jgi:hypothetical protein
VKRKKEEEMEEGKKKEEGGMGQRKRRKAKKELFIFFPDHSLLSHCRVAQGCAWKKPSPEYIPAHTIHTFLNCSKLVYLTVVKWVTPLNIIISRIFLYFAKI